MSTQSKKPLVIGIIQQTPAVAGAEQYMLSLMRAFKDEKHTIYFATNNSLFAELAGKITPHIDHIPVILDIIGNIKGLLKSLFYLPKALIYYTNLLRKYKHNGVTVLLMSGFSEKLLITFLSLFFDIPVVWIEYGRLGGIFKRNFFIPKIIYRISQNIPKYVIVPTSYTLESLVTDALVSTKRLRCIPCGVSFDVSEKIDNKLQETYKNNIIIGNISRLTKEKGQQFLILAAPKILSVFPEARFLLVGEWWERELPYFQDLIKDLGLREKVKLLGYVPDVEPYYSLFDLFVFPTVWELEGFGLVTVEAMARRIPVIASDIGPVNEIVKNGKTGILVSPADPDALANAVISLLKNKKEQKVFSENAYIMAKKLYDIKTINKQVLAVLQEAIY